MNGTQTKVAAASRGHPRGPEEYKKEGQRLQYEADQFILTNWFKWSPDPASAYPKYREAAKAYESAEDYPKAVFCHLWAAQFEYQAGDAKELSKNPSRAACGCGVEQAVDDRNAKKTANPKRRSKPIERAAQITLEQRLDMNDEPNLVAAFYQNAGNIHLSERDNHSAAKCLRIGARALKEVDKTRAAILYMESCNLILPPTAEVAYIPPNAGDEFLEALRYMLSINKLAMESNRWLPEALSLLRRLCFILDHEKKFDELYAWFLADIVLLLTLPDVEMATESLLTHEKHRPYLEMSEHALAKDLVKAFNQHDDATLSQVQFNAENLNIDPAVLRLIKQLSIFRGFS